MPLPTSLPETAAGAYGRVVATAQSCKSNLSGVGNLIAAGGPLVADNLIGLYQNLNAARATGVSIQAVDGLPDYAKTALGDPAYDIVAAFGASIIACKAVTDWLLANMPSDGNGGFVGWQHQADGTITRRAIDGAALAPLSALIATALATFA